MGAEAVLGQLDSAISKAQNLPSQLIDALNGMINKFNSVLAAVPGWLQGTVGWIVDEAKKLFEQLKELTMKLLDWLDKNVWPVIRGPYTLYQASNDWISNVYHPVSTVSGETNTAEMTVWDWWQGTAAIAYSNIMPVQKAASDKVAEMATKTKDTLQTVAFGLASIYITLLIALLGLLIKWIADIGAIASIVAALPGILDAIGNVLIGLAAVGVLVTAAEAIAKDALGSFTTLLQMKDDSGAFENGHWPKDTGALGAIGSTSQGAWQLR